MEVFWNFEISPGNGIMEGGMMEYWFSKGY
jgi:hypothetical protein